MTRRWRPALYAALGLCACLASSARCAQDLGYEVDLLKGSQAVQKAEQDLALQIAAEKKGREDEAMAALSKEIEGNVGKKSYYVRTEQSRNGDYFSLRRLSLNKLGEARLLHDSTAQKKADMERILRIYRNTPKIAVELIRSAESEIAKLEGKQALIEKYLKAAGTDDRELQDGRDYLLIRQPEKLFQ
jgi:hypothetical protein